MKRLRGLRAIATASLCAFAILIFASIPFHEQYNAKEDTVRLDLLIMRNALDQYTLDKRQRPQRLADLVYASYLKEIPADPITGRDDTWRLHRSSDAKTPGIDDIHSGSNSKARDGTFFSDW